MTTVYVVYEYSNGITTILGVFSTCEKAKDEVDRLTERYDYDLLGYKFYFKELVLDEPAKGW